MKFLAFFELISKITVSDLFDTKAETMIFEMSLKNAKNFVRPSQEISELKWVKFIRF